MVGWMGWMGQSVGGLLPRRARGPVTVWFGVDEHTMDRHRVERRKHNSTSVPVQVVVVCTQTKTNVETPLVVVVVVVVVVADLPWCRFVGVSYSTDIRRLRAVRASNSKANRETMTEQCCGRQCVPRSARS